MCYEAPLGMCAQFRYDSQLKHPELFFKLLNW